jgi:hypothetical protein
MARQNMRPVPYLKNMEAYNDFSGGLNTVTSNDNLRNNEFADLENVDLAERGSLKRRSGMVAHIRSSRNLLPKFSAWTLPGGVSPSSDYTVTISTSGQFAKVEVPIKASTRYAFSRGAGIFQVFFLDEANAVISGIYEPMVFDTPSNAVKIRVETALTGTYTNPQLELGGTATTFSPKGIPHAQAQGYFRYAKADGTMEEIIAVDGKLYKGNVELPITGLSSFQTTRPIEAVQYKTTLYIATGTKLVSYDGTIAKVVEAYKPEALEVLYIGTNALADNPDQFITDSTSAAVQVTGITADKRYGVANTGTTFTAYVAKPAGSVIEYKWEWRTLGSDTWVAWNSRPDFTVDQKTFGFWVGTGDYEIRCLARVQGETNEVNYGEYRIPKYTFKETNENKVEDTSTIHQCNRVILHWERLIMYGDPKQKDMIYISDVGRPDYFPTLNTLRFENEHQEGLTALVKFRDMVVAFTPHTVQGLFGTSPADYNRLMLSSSVGCIAPYSAQVMENYITFLSLEGVHILKSVGYSESRVNVEKIDTAIDNIVPRDTDACAIVADGQYQIVFPQRELRLRYYYQGNLWTKDVSPKIDFRRMYAIEGIVYGHSNISSTLMKMDGNVWTDDGHVYRDRYVFKDYDFNEPYNPKKLKEMQLLLGQSARTNLSIYVYADGAAIVSPNDSHAAINADGEVEWVAQNTPNLTVEAGTVLGSWIMGNSAFGNIESGIQKMSLSGKCRRVRLEIIHEEATPNTVLGVGFIFKSKKP